MRIAIVSTMPGVPWPWGGSEALWAAFAAAALDEGHEVHAWLYEPLAQAREVIELASRGMVLHLRRRRFARWSQLLRRLPAVDIRWRSLDRFRAEGLLISQGSTFDLVRDPEYAAVLRLLARGDSAFALLSHGGHDWDYPSSAEAEALRRMAGRARWLAFVSQRNIEIATRQVGATLPRCRVVRNPLQLEGKGYLTWPADTTVRWASVGRLETGVKGLDLLLEALSSPVWAERSWQWTAYGSGRDGRRLEELAAYYGLEKQVVFAGYETDVEKIWRDNQLLLLPSRSEALPICLVEAMVCGRPVLATEVGGVREWLREGETGFLAEGATLTSLRAALERAWEQRGAWEAMGRRARELALERVDPAPGRTLLHSLLEHRS